MGAEKIVVSFPRDCHAYACNDKVFRLRPKRTPIRSVLINVMWNFEDVTKPPTASLWSGLFDVHSFKEHLFTECAYSKRTYKRNVLIRNKRSQGERRDKCRAYVTHKPILQRLQQVAIVCLLVFVFLFPHAKTALSSFLLTRKFACF